MITVSISPEKPSLTFDGTYWFLRIAPDALIVMTEVQADEVAQKLFSRNIGREGWVTLNTTGSTGSAA